MSIRLGATLSTGMARTRAPLAALATAVLISGCAAATESTQSRTPTTAIVVTTTPPTTTNVVATSIVPEPTTTTTTVPPTRAPTTVPPQTFDATLTWDGEECSFDGPTEVKAGDTLNLTRVNNTDDYGWFQVLYMTTGTTLEVASDFFDNKMGNVLDDDSPPPPSFLLLVEDADDLLPQNSRTIAVKLRQPREHLFV